METLESLAADAVGKIREALALHEERRTQPLRSVADLFLRLRLGHEDPKGRGADLTGRSKDYRNLISSIYEEAFDGTPDEVRTRVTSQIRYHVSAAVRDHLSRTPGALELYGLNPKSVKERAADRIKQRRALLDMGLIDEATSHSSPTARLMHGARYLVQLAADEGLEGDQEDRRYVRHGASQIARDLPTFLTDVDKIRTACELLHQVAEPVSPDVDPDLASITEDAVRLRRHTTTVENTVGAIDGLLERYAPEEHRRKA